VHFVGRPLPPVTGPQRAAQHEPELPLGREPAL
jgi:hypothetical protein